MEIEKIQGIYADLEHAVRSRLSAILMETSEEKPMKCDVVLDTHYHGSSNDAPHIESIFQHPIEGIIVCNMDGGYELELDDIPLDEQIQILKELE